MEIRGSSAAVNYLESLPLHTITKHPGKPPKNALPFLGYPRQHPAEKGKIILVYDPLGENPALMEFMLDDILFIEEVPQAVTEKGEGIPLIKLWIRKGAHGMFLDPFEVDESLHFMEIHREQKERFSKTQET